MSPEFATFSSYCSLGLSRFFYSEPSFYTFVNLILSSSTMFKIAINVEFILEIFVNFKFNFEIFANFELNIQIFVNGR